MSEEIDMAFKFSFILLMLFLGTSLSFSAARDCAPIKDTLKSFWKPALPKKAHLGMDAHPQTMQLYNQLNLDDKVELVTTLKDYQKFTQATDAQMLEKVAEFQKSCLSGGNFQRGCLFLRLSALKKESQNLAYATGTTVSKKPMLSMSQRFSKYVKNTPRRVSVGTKKYVRDVIKTKGKRLFVKYRKQGVQSRNPFKNPMGYLNNPVATIRDAKWQVTTPVSILGFTLLVDIPLSMLESEAQQNAVESAEQNKGNLMGGEYVWSFMESGILPPEEVPAIFDKHDVEFDQWLNKELGSLPRLDELAKVLGLSGAEKAMINLKARELYLKELDLFVAKYPSSSQAQRTAFHDELQAKFFTLLETTASLSRYSSSEKELLSTAYFPLLSLDGKSDVSVAHYLVKHASGSTKEIMDRLQEGLTLPLALYMTMQQQADPQLVSRKIQRAKEMLPADLQNVARRPDLPFLDTELKLSPKPGGAPVALKDELTRWSVLTHDPRFKEIYDLYKSGELDQYTVMEYFEQAVPAFNEINQFLAQGTLSDKQADGVLENRLFSSVKEDLRLWQKHHPKDARYAEVKMKVVKTWLEFHRELGAGKKPSIDDYTLKYQSLLQ